MTSALHSLGRLGAADAWWFLHDDSPRARAEDLALLSAPERNRAARLVADVALRRFVASRAGVRRQCAAYLGGDPAAVDIRLDRTGKPFLPGGPRVSWSTSGNVTALALCLDHEVGVDIERIRPIPEASTIARRWISADLARAIEREASPDAAALSFLSAWTLREAHAKATGTGLRDDPGQSVVDASLWDVHAFHGPGWVGALLVGRERTGPGALGSPSGRGSTAREKLGPFLAAPWCA